MAWIAVEMSNDAMVSRLIELKVISSESLEQAFRMTDRGDFIGDKRCAVSFQMIKTEFSLFTSSIYYCIVLTHTLHFNQTSSLPVHQSPHFMLQSIGL
jgi:hypothetical protein